MFSLYQPNQERVNRKLQTESAKVLKFRSSQNWMRGTFTYRTPTKQIEVKKQWLSTAIVS